MVASVSKQNSSLPQNLKIISKIQNERITESRVMVQCTVQIMKKITLRGYLNTSECIRNKIVIQPLIHPTKGALDPRSFSIRKSQISLSFNHIIQEVGSYIIVFTGRSRTVQYLFKFESVPPFNSKVGLQQGITSAFSPSDLLSDSEPSPPLLFLGNNPQPVTSLVSKAQVILIRCHKFMNISLLNQQHPEEVRCETTSFLKGQVTLIPSRI